MEASALILQAVRAVQNGEESSWNFLYQYYYPKLYAVALDICGASPESKDVVHDTFVAAYLKLSHLKEAANFEGWIRRILQRNCYRYLYKSRLAKKQDLHSFADIDISEYLQQKLDRPFYYHHMYNILMELPEALLAALLLRYFSPYPSYQEIAKILSIPVGTVRSRLNEAKRKLVGKWNQPPSNKQNVFKQTREWNQFYYELFARAHHEETEKNRLLNHLGKSVKIVFPGGIQQMGSGAFEKLIIDDHKHGSWLTPVQVISCGNVSIVEIKHFNSVEHPHHCPPGSVAVLCRGKTQVHKLNLHLVFG